VPLDNYFDRKHTPEERPPVTCLEFDAAQRFYGGPAEWSPLSSPKREWLAGEGRKNLDKPGLEPGQSATTFVCTDGDDDQLAERLKDYEGNLFWRVHVRCGPVQYENRLLAATAVVGVEFSDRDYRKDN
jgi:hypothetical protein